MQKSNVGLIGLGTMGQAFARNLASRGHRVSLWNRSYEKITNFVEEFGSESFYAPSNFEDFVESLERPRKVILLVPAGEATNATMRQLVPALEEKDVIMDGGNAMFKVTELFQQQLSKKGIHFLGCGVSGGEEGALKGPSMMPGGTWHAWEQFEPILKPAAAEDFKGRACVSYMGKGGAGHYVKMVHNGIEYAEMQMLAEAYDLLKTLYKLQSKEIAAIFKGWAQGRLGSFLVDISIDVLEKEEEGKPLLDLIMDKAKQKGTGRWTSQEALALGVPTPSITGAVFMRGFSMNKEKRQQIEQEYALNQAAPQMFVSDFAKHLEKALYASRIANFEQGFELLRAADEEYKYGLNFAEIVRVWQGGCIIRSVILKDMHTHFEAQNESLYLADFVKTALKDAESSWKEVVALATKHSVPLIALSGALTHFEAYRHGRLPANFIQGLRDRFGSHTYERVDKEGQFHANWED